MGRGAVRRDRSHDSRGAVPLIADTRILLEHLSTVLAPDFRLLRPLREGAMAHVYLAGETALERLVAVKVLRPELATDATVRRRFAREARAAARIAHPGVVVVHRVGELPEGLPYLVMEYVEGRTLEDVLAADAPHDLALAREWLTQLAAALATAHEKRIIHRDVRPANILLEDATGRVVLTDFGIAGIKESGNAIITRLTRAGESLGDPRYASPEQLLGEPVTEATDVYSLGVVAYEVLSGAGPFAADVPREMVAAHLLQAPRDLREMRADVPAELVRLIERCLAKKPEHRPRAAEVAEALAAMGREPASAPHNLVSGSAAAEDGEPPFFPALASFLAELRRRRVYRAVATYLAAAFLVLQGADLVLPALSVSSWVYLLLVTAAVGGFPILLVLTWIFDVNRGGIQRTPAALSDPLLPGDKLVRRALQILGIGFSVLAAALLGWWMLG